VIVRRDAGDALEALTALTVVIATSAVMQDQATGQRAALLDPIASCRYSGPASVISRRPNRRGGGQGWGP
jgi:hypothetical protein